jgi:taurine dioxygenase
VNRGSIEYKLAGMTIQKSGELEVTALKGRVGASVRGLDLGQALDKEMQSFLYQLWLDKGIIIFRDCPVTPEQHIEFSRYFGELEIHPIESLRVKGNDELNQLPPRSALPPPINYYDGMPRSNRIHWHSDMMYTIFPTRGAVLRVIELPAESGETAWVDTALAYECLSDVRKATIENLEARFSFTQEGDEVLFGRSWTSFRREGERSVKYQTFPDVVHKIVAEHPQSGRKSLNLSPLFLKNIIGMNDVDSFELLSQLVDHCLQEEFRYLHHWHQNDIALWDNLRTFHSAYGTVPGVKRIAQRTTLKNTGSVGRLL